jgi:GTPase
MTEVLTSETKDSGASEMLPMKPAEANAIRIAVIGNVDSGKSTLVGVLTRNTLDDG